ncbi:chloride channel protein [Adhaeribacter terreus]|uniref:Chloride channel protein n=1 Tax=Adhaeribacter terreus TaxID=529703 RepID=A0ABW0EAK7_9BACT
MLPFILSVVVGSIVGLSAILIKTLISYIELYVVYFSPKAFFFLFPLVGFLVVTFLNQHVFKKISSFQGTRNVVDAIENKASIINFRLMYSKFVTTGLTIGFGGSSGVEAAIITSGSAIGSNVGQLLGLGYRLRTLLIGCGIAAGISAVYNAPMGGFIFALETVLPEFTPTLLIPLLISAATGKILFEFIMGNHLRFDAPITDFTYDQLPLVIMLGILTMIGARYLARTYDVCRQFFTRIKNVYLRALAGGLALGCVIFFLPAMYGEGYSSIDALLEGSEKSLLFRSPLAQIPFSTWFSLFFFFLLTLVKPLSTGICVNSGGEGGYFAPSIITGGFLGFLFYKIMSQLVPGADLSAVTYIFLGMAGMFACVMNAPVTAIFLIAEITQSYQLFIPLMVVCAVSYLLKYYSENLSFKIDQASDMRKSFRIDRIILNQINVKQLIEKDFPVIPVGASFRELLEVYGNSNRNMIQVIGENKLLVGLINVSEIRKIMPVAANYDAILVKDIMEVPPASVQTDEPPAQIMAKFDQLNVRYLPVFKKGRLKGFISRNRMLLQYREELTRANRFI